MVIVDTTVWIDYLRLVDNPEIRWLEQNLHKQRLGITDLILCEILQGVRDPGMYVRTKADLLAFHVFNTGGIDMAIATAQNYRLLRERGYTVRKTIDCVIATFCLQAGHELLHRDQDYDPFEKVLGLRVVRA